MPQAPDTWDIVQNAVEFGREEDDRISCGKVLKSRIFWDKVWRCLIGRAPRQATRGVSEKSGW